MGWKAQAACAGQWELFDAAGEQPGAQHPASRRARALCQTCPVVTQCLIEAIQRGEHGIWGGTSPHMRTRLAHAS